MRCLLMILFILLTSTSSIAQVTLVTDRTEYEQGEAVEITIHNGTQEAVELVSSPWYCIARTDGPYPACLGLPVVLTLPAGETWVAYHDTSELPDPPGQYVVYPASPVAEPAAYTLVAPVENDRAHDWSTLKASYR